jgi:PadR family transcriptional regulator, regulatory protein PadR
VPRNVIDAVQGTLDFMILKTLSWGEMHGYAIANWIKDATEAELQIEEGTLYPALHRLEHKGLIEAEWGTSDNNRRAKFYSLTALGKKELRARTADWARYARAVERVLTLKPGSV